MSAHNEAIGCAIWIVILVAIGLAALIVTGCCASTCENMLAECERGLEQHEPRPMSACEMMLQECERDLDSLYESRLDRRVTGGCASSR